MRASRRNTLKSKLLQLTLSIMLLTVSATIISLAWSSRQAEQERLRETTRVIHESIAIRATTLARGHALALRGLAIDNAYGDVKRLIIGAVHADDDMIYGLFVGSDDRPWAYESTAQSLRQTASQDDVGSTRGLPVELNLAPGALQKNSALHRDEKHLFDQLVYEVSAPVLDDQG